LLLGSQYNSQGSDHFDTERSGTTAGSGIIEYCGCRPLFHRHGQHSGFSGAESPFEQFWSNALRGDDTAPAAFKSPPCTIGRWARKNFGNNSLRYEQILAQINQQMKLVSFGQCDNG
jgi:hypothetical protein